MLLGSRSRDERAINSVLQRYAAMVDTKSVAGVEDCFTPDATLEIITDKAGGQRRPIQLAGRRQIGEAFARTIDKLPVQLHFVVNHRIEVNRPSATSHSAFLRMDALGGVPSAGSFGTYEDTWHRGHDRRWRIESRSIKVSASVANRAVGRAEVDGLDLLSFDDERQIREVVMRYSRAIDRRDLTAVADCYHPDATDHHGTYVGGVAGFLDRLRAELPKCERTVHFVGNVLIDHLDHDRARCESYVLAFHRLGARGEKPPRDRTVSLRYLDRFERRDGVWRIATRRCVVEWTRTDPVALGWDFGPEHLLGVPGPEDLIYGPW